VIASGLPVHAPSSPTGDISNENGIALLLDLMEHEPAPTAAGGEGLGWVTRAQDWSQRAAAWGAGPQGAWGAW